MSEIQHGQIFQFLFQGFAPTSGIELQISGFCIFEYISSVCLSGVCVCAGHHQVCEGQRTYCCTRSLPPPCQSWGWNSNLEVLQQLYLLNHIADPGLFVYLFLNGNVMFLYYDHGSGIRKSSGNKTSKTVGLNL